MAITRARESLYLLNYSQKPGSKGKTTKVKSSMFLKELKGDGHVGTLKDQALDEKRQAQISGVVVSKTLFL